MSNKNQSIKEDIEIVCICCGKKFIFSAGEQFFYREKGLNFPKRCKVCRDINKKSKGERVPTLIGKKNPPKINPTTDNSERPKKMLAQGKARSNSGKRCGDCAIGNTDKCPNQMHHSGNLACEDFVSKDILTEEMEQNFPTYGKATWLRYGKAGKSQFKRSKRETHK